MSDEQGPGAGGEVVGVYRLERQLGKGGMGEVYLAYDERLDRRVAVKRIRRQGEASERQRQRFRLEARAAAKLSHPAIAQVYDVVLDDAGDSIVMEYVPGRTLGQLLAAGELDAPAALRAAVQVAEGLAAAHGKGFVHRDLKKENVMVTPEGQAKILDFGLAKELRRDDGSESLTERGALLGTVTSMSPEQAAGLPVDARSDLFSFGVLLYEIFTGRSPFRRENPLQTLQSVVHEDPPPPRALRPELPAELSALIVALLEKDSGRRPASAAEVAAELHRIAGSPGLAGLAIPSAASDRESWMTAPSDAPTAGPRAAGSQATAWRGLPRPSAVSGTAESATPTVPGAETSRRRRWLAAGLAAATLALIVASAAFLWPRAAVPERRVVVLEPAASASEAGVEIDLAAFAVLEASLGTLAALQGIDAVQPSKVSGSAATAEEAAREVAADEALEIRLECRPGWCWVSFYRLRGSDGVTLEVGERFEVPSRAADSLDLTRAVRRYLPDLYPQNPPLPGTPPPDFQPEDYGRFLALRKRSEAGEVLGEEELEELEAILESSPRLLAGHLLAAGVARFLGQHPRALAFAADARELAPRDPRPLFQRFQVELAMDEVEKAAATLAELERLAPGNLRVSRSRAELLAEQGRLEEAVEVWRQIVERQPAWRNVLALASHAAKVGDHKDARARLEELLRDYPDNLPILSQLALVETRSGQFERAVELYQHLLGLRPRSVYFHNLGWVQFLAGNHERAVEAFESALELSPDDPETRFNLAAALEAAGRRDEALALYGLVLDELSLAPGGPEILVAQCQVRLSQARQALATVDRLVRESPADAQVAYQAGEVSALAGDHIAAVYYLRKALDQGLSPRWLQNPSFRSLQGVAEFRHLKQRPIAP